MSNTKQYNYVFAFRFNSKEMLIKEVDYMFKILGWGEINMDYINGFLVINQNKNLMTSLLTTNLSLGEILVIENNHTKLNINWSSNTAMLYTAVNDATIYEQLNKCNGIVGKSFT